MKPNSLKKSRGFTLVEILIVVIIVGLLADVAVFKLGDNKERAVAAVKKSAVAELNKAIQVAYVKGDVISSAALAPLGTSTGTCNGQGARPSATGVIGLTEIPEIKSQFTFGELLEMRLNIVNPTPNSGTVTLNGDHSHGGIEVVYTAPVP